MKPLSTRRKLPLRKEHLRILADTELARARGGTGVNGFIDQRTAVACTQTCFSCDVGTSEMT